MVSVNIASSAASVSDFQQSVRYHVKYSVGKVWEQASRGDLYNAVALTIRERLIDGMLATEKRYNAADAKRLYYLSMEFLMGRSLGNNIYNLEVYDLARGQTKHVLSMFPGTSRILRIWRGTIIPCG